MRPAEHSPARRRAALAAAVVALAVAGLAMLCAVLLPRHLPSLRDPRLIDVVFDSRAVILTARLVLVALALVLAVAGIFVVVSTAARMRNGDWLRRAGPFEVSEARVAVLEDEAHFWRSAARDYYDEIERIHDLNNSDTPPRDMAFLDDDYDTI